MSEHTPGPWKIYRGTKNNAIIGIGDADAGGVTDAHFGLWRSGAEYEANARLIASAPDLLAACQRAYGAARDHGHGSEYLRDAIAKATGEQP